MDRMESQQQATTRGNNWRIAQCLRDLSLFPRSCIAYFWTAFLRFLSLCVSVGEFKHDCLFSFWLGVFLQVAVGCVGVGGLGIGSIWRGWSCGVLFYFFLWFFFFWLIAFCILPACKRACVRVCVRALDGWLDR